MRWAVVIGALCVVASVPLFIASYQAANRPAPRSDDKRLARLCEEQKATQAGSEACAASSAGTDSARAAIGGAVLLVLGLSQLAAAARLGVTVTRTGVIIRNPMRTYRLRWSEIEDFRMEAGTSGKLGYAFGWVDAIDGTSRRLEAICVMPWERPNELGQNETIETLKADLAEARAEAAPTAPTDPVERETEPTVEER